MIHYSALHGPLEHSVAHANYGTELRCLQLLNHNHLAAIIFVGQLASVNACRSVCVPLMNACMARLPRFRLGPVPLLSMQRSISTVAPPLTQSATPALLMEPPIGAIVATKAPPRHGNAAFAVVQLAVPQLHTYASTDEQPEVPDSVDLSLHG